MKTDSKRSNKLLPLWASTGVLGIVSLIHLATQIIPGFTLFKHLEWITYDWRVKQAAKRSPPKAPNLGFVFIQDESIAALLEGDLDYKAALYWPRHVYGRLAKELATQGAKAVAFDILFPNPRPDPVTHDTHEAPDDFFARTLRETGNVILAAEKGVQPLPLFAANALAIGDISTSRESDGILRQTKAFHLYHTWHRLIQGAARQQGFDLRRAVFESDQIRFPIVNHPDFVIPLENGEFDQIALYRQLTGQAPPAGSPRLATPATTKRVWDLGIVIAAEGLDLDLENALIQPGQIVIPGPPGANRVIPVDPENQFYIDWAIKPTDPILRKEAIEFLLHQEYQRRLGATDLTNRWRDKLVVVGSVASGNDLTDLGATPLEQETYLTSRLWNVANSVLLNRFIRPPSATSALGFTALLCFLVAPLAWRLRATSAASLTLLLGGIYVTLGLWWFVQDRVWIPLILPLTGLSLSLVSVLGYKTAFEQKERRRVKEIFAKIVSPDVVNELLNSDELSLGGAHRNVTVFFADVRGFTQLTDESQARAEEHVRTHHLDPSAALAYYNHQAQEVLSTVNLYLSLVADIIKKNEGTLDKYIGDCVMAFWGAPNPNPRHAVCAVRSAIEAQRAIQDLNAKRARQNQQIDLTNKERMAYGLQPQPNLPQLSLGTGINTGNVTVGLMGSHAHIVNFTVFGRDINLASRLESLSGHDRIIIGKNTYQELLRDDPQTAAQCVQLEPTSVKGFREAVTAFEVLWSVPKEPAAPAAASTPPPT